MPLSFWAGREKSCGGRRLKKVLEKSPDHAYYEEDEERVWWAMSSLTRRL